MLPFSRWIGSVICLAVLFPATAAPAQDRDRAVGEGPGRKGVAVFAAVEDRTTVLFAVTEGAWVEKGAMVCEFDSSTLKERLANQELLFESAEASLRGAKLAREAAELASAEYLRSGFKGEFIAAMREIALADAERKRAEDRIMWSDRMYEKGYVSKAENIADKIDLQQKVFAFEQAETKKDVLERYTKDKTIKELRREVEEAKAIELARQAASKREEATRKKLIRQIESCKLYAPAGGRVSYTAPIEAGAIVDEGQLLLRVIPEDAPGGKAK